MLARYSCHNVLRETLCSCVLAKPIYNWKNSKFNETLIRYKSKRRLVLSIDTGRPSEELRQSWTPAMVKKILLIIKKLQSGFIYTHQL